MNLDPIKAFEFLEDKAGRELPVEMLEYVIADELWSRKWNYPDVRIRPENRNAAYIDANVVPYFENDWLKTFIFTSHHTIFTSGFKVAGSIAVSPKGGPYGTSEASITFGYGTMDEIEIFAKDLDNMFPHQGARELKRDVDDYAFHPTYNTSWDLTDYVHKLPFDIDCEAFIWNVHIKN